MSQIFNRFVLFRRGRDYQLISPHSAFPRGFQFVRLLVSPGIPDHLAQNTSSNANTSTTTPGDITWWLGARGCKPRPFTSSMR
jgi:hypothetical protein